MFDIGFSELVVIGVVALIVIGPERLPKVARTAGLLYGRLQRYVSSVKSDISREIQLDEIRRAGQSFKESVEAAASDVERQATVVDDYLRNEVSNIKQSVTATEAGEERPVESEPAGAAETAPSPQQSLPLDEPDQNPGRAPAAATNRGESADKSA
ncbi:MAG: Sec-independent protein translocase protein TatB [Betaproteobacteria bacterium]|nr:Sec-independent protein translocase protein TatB [Betaproteobacteria bacterium]